MNALRKAVIVVWSFLIVVALIAAEEGNDYKEREYAVSPAAIRLALQSLGASKPDHLPSLEGFATPEGTPLDRFERPYYEFKTDLISGSPGKTLLKIRATISAWYAEPGGSGGYRVLKSNGRLEDDFLDRVTDYLKKNPTSQADVQSVEQQIAETRKNRQATAEQIADLEAKLKSGNTTPAAPQTGEEFVGVVSGKVKVLAAPSERAAAFFNADPDDEFEVLERSGTYVKVKVDDDRVGWLPKSQVRSSGAAGSANREPLFNSFNVVKQAAMTFDGDWLPLKGKNALYLWARPVGSALNHTPASHLQFAEETFSQYYREAAHNSKNSLDGLVIIFLDQGGGVAAATFEDVKQWRNGNLPQPAFLKKCSFDPHAEFAEAPAKTPPLRAARHGNGGL